ncbi:hypothetical protein [Microcoleus sp. PH2017_21_RUC_O_A]|nr:hypothetical protein [Microcoleus sp. PH2017_21_RUC_O_A]
MSVRVPEPMMSGGVGREWGRGEWRMGLVVMTSDRQTITVDE